MNQVRHITVFINAPPSEVYEYASRPENLPNWASGLSGTIEKIGDDWIAQSPMGKVKIRFADTNEFGVLDHEVILESGAKFYNPMRVFPNGMGSELVFSLFKTPDMSDDKFAADAEWVLKDLMKLKSIIEKN